MQRLDKKDISEKAVTAAFFIGVFLPVRLVFYTYVSEWWLGSFGMMAGMLAGLFYMQRRGWLGRLGFVITRQVERISTGRIGKWGLVLSVFALYMYGHFIFGIEHDPVPAGAAMSAALESRGVTDVESLMEQSRGISLQWWHFAAGLAVLLIPNETAWGAYSIINDLSDGWFLHFATVIFVQELEFLGILVYFRYIRRRIKKP